MEHIYQCVAWMSSLTSCNLVTYITHHNLYDVEAGNTLDQERKGDEKCLERSSSQKNAWHCNDQDEKVKGVKVTKEAQQAYNQAIVHTCTVP